MIDKRISFRGGGMDASRSDFGSSSRSSRSSNTSGSNRPDRSDPNPSSSNSYSPPSSGSDDRSSDLQDYNHRVAQAARQGLTIPEEQPTLLPREQMQQAFRNFRPEMPKIPLGLGSLVLQMINPGGKGPLQAFSDFSANKNRNYFMDEVVRAGKIPGLNYGTVADMTPEKLDKFYKDYLADRGSGSIDAYGNPIGGQEDSSGITSIYDARPYQMVQNVEVEDPVQNLFASRFLQNQPDQVRESIEANMPIRFPNLFT